MGKQSEFRPRLFIGSSKPNLPLAVALQDHLRSAATVTVWDQSAIRSNRVLRDELFVSAEGSDFAVFVAGPDEPRGRGAKPPYHINQNVLYEIGLFSGIIGKENVFVAVPNTFARSIALPTDLAGVMLPLYDRQRFDEDGNARAAMAGAAAEILSMMGPGSAQSRARRVEVRLFPFWTDAFDELLTHAKSLSACFIHSRRWRDNHGTRIVERLKSGKFELSLFMPDLSDDALIADLKQRFDDGPTIAAMLVDHGIWAHHLMKMSSRVKVYRYQRIPAFSFYRFDDAAIVALYPNSSIRQPSPTVLVPRGSAFWQFLVSDEEDLLRECNAYREDTLRLAVKELADRELVPGFDLSSLER